MSGYLRRAAAIAMPCGALGTELFTFWAGRRNDSRILVGIFAIWVLVPFAALFWANAVSGRWRPPTRTTLYGLTLFLSLISLAIYGYSALRPPKAQAAFAFVVVPPASCLLMILVLSAARLTSRRHPPQGRI